MLNGKNDKVAILTRNQKVTYGELKNRVNQYSELFRDLKDTRIAIFSENRVEWVYAFYAAWKNNVVPVPIDYMAGIDDVSFIIDDCNPEIIFCSKDRHGMLLDSLKEIKHNPRIIVFEEIDNSVDGNKSEEKITQSEIIEENVAVIIYTSGTTGSPKGVMLTYGNLISNIVAVSDHVKIYNKEDRVMLLLPLHHIFPLLGSMIIPLYKGATIAMSPSLNADDILKTLQKHKVTILIGVPRLYSIIRKGIIDKINQSTAARLMFKLARTLKSTSFSKMIFKTVHEKFGGNLRFMIAGGAPLDPEVGVDFRTLGFDILEGYGMTEAAPMITFTRPKKFYAGSAGFALPGTTIEIREGEIVAAGKNIMKGYYNRPEETEDILKDGWLYTGDLGYLDKKGHIFITGRKKEIIVLSNGKNINPAEIENKIEKLSPLIKEVGVFMMNDKLNLIIVPDKVGIEKEKIEDVQAYFKNTVLKPFNARATSSKRLLKLHISYDELPKTRLSKIQRFKLVEFVESIHVEEKKQHQLPESKELQTIIDFIAQTTGQPVYIDDKLEEDVALDSLAKITLIVYLENTFGVSIKEDELYNFKTVNDLGKHILESKIRHTPELINWTNILKEKIQFKVPKAGFSFNLVHWGYRILVAMLLRLKGEGVSNIPDEPCIIAPNHQSYLDGFLIAATLKRRTMRKTYFYAKEKYWRTGFKRFVARKNNVILMDISKDLKLSLQKMAEVLRKGKNIIIFPEGTRSGDGNVQQFKKTFAILAQELKVPIVPVAINGSHNALPSGAFFPRLFARISVTFMKPIYPNKQSYDSLMEEVQEAVEGQVNADEKK
jgi:long-chain acyl-CoA synthetase